MIDLTFVNSSLLKGNTCWMMSNTCTLSDHCDHSLESCKTERESENRLAKINRFTGWKASTFDADASRLCMEAVPILLKGNKPPDEPSSYRSLYMLDSLFHFQPDRGRTGHLLADSQYGFRKGRSTIDAINQVVGKGNEAISVKWLKDGSKKYCLLVTLGVKNAFNSRGWKNICQALDKLDVSAYLKNVIKSYLTNRLLVYDTVDGPKEY